MIKRYILLIFSVLSFCSCGGFDGSSILDELKNHEERISALESLCKDINTNIASMGNILTALVDNDYVTGTTTLTEGGTVVGHIIHFSKSGSVTIYHGNDGDDALGPDVGVKKAGDGRYYWTSGDDWMTDEEGEKIPATVTDPDDGYVVPQFRVVDGIWYLSYDNGNSWKEIGTPQNIHGNGPLFQDVDLSNPEYIVLTIYDGQQIMIPTWQSFQELEELINDVNGSLASLQALIDAMQNNDYVTGIVPVMQDGKEVGYTIRFANGDSINIYHGKDGESGATPSISLAQDTDGVYYWTLEGEWMYDDAGDKIPCTLVPRLKVEDGYWYVSYDEGNTWEEDPLGPSSELIEGMMFAEVRYDAEFLYITLADGQEVRLLRYDGDFSSVVKHMDELSISNSVATVSGRLKLDPSEYVYCQVSLYYSDSSVFNIYDAECISTTAFDADGGFTFSIPGLQVGKEYTWCICVKLKSRKFYSIVEKFTVPHPYSEIKYLDAASAQDLSYNGTANCYIVTQSGLYKFKAVKGNTSEKINSVSSAEILWESFGTATAPAFFDLIDGVCYKDGYVLVRISDEFKEGNAVVAVKDAEGKVLWSWHIWMTDMPAGQVYYNTNITVMDRNLGAVSVTPGDVGALGLMYQWGRKDPFLGSSSINSAKKALSTITWPKYVASDSFTGTQEYALSNPTTFIAFNKMNDDWLYTDSAAADTTRWTVSTAPKSVNDPCPYGWRVPEGGTESIWAKALGIKTSGTYTFDSENYGIQHAGQLGDDENIWYPAAGCLDHVNGEVIRIGSTGAFWTVTDYKSNSPLALPIYWVSNGSFYAYFYGKRAIAFPVRCVKY